MSDIATGTPNRRALIPVIISGGSGTRLWPLSRETRPKQFLPLVDQSSLYQQTLLRVQRLGGAVAAPIVVCNATHRDFVLTQSREVGIEPRAIVLEPAGRNTAPAVALAASLTIQNGAGSAAAPLLLVLPADHVIIDEPAFAAAVDVAIEAAKNGRLVTFGVVPDRPETGYGYIRRGAISAGWAEVGEFVEKPERATAEAYVASGEYWWNSGMFLFSAAQFLEELRVHAGGIVDACQRAVAEARRDGVVIELGAEFTDCPADSIDYAVMEKTAHGAVVPLSAGWSDVGSWSALHDLLPHDAEGNSTLGDAMLESCRNSYVSAGKRLVAVVGVDDVIVVETDDAVLVLRRDRAQDVKKIVDALKAQRRRET